tara:strand:- start:64 stop:558 length:495 start_codon:yes stop_codon:yes gene_type:complete
MINVYNLFAVRMVHCKLLIPLDLHKKIILFSENKYKECDTISCVKGFQFHKDFKGKKELDSILDNYMMITHRLKINHSWLNVLGNDSLNLPHKHEGNDVIYSAAYYLSNDNSIITFVKDDEIFEIKPKMFDLLIFPHNLVHYVLPGKKSDKRICYSFNLEKIHE